MLTASMEDYLEMFYRIVVKQSYVRPVDLSKAVHVRPSSVTRMIQKLDETEFITYQKYRNIALTDKGLRYGRFLVWRDETLKEFLQLIRSNTSIAEQVEGIEHYITPPTMKIFSYLTLYFNQHPENLAKLEMFQQQSLYPEHEDLSKLRAWLFRYDSQ
ncbi:MAG TPA: transcriptional regulator MntR [Firmicutes bacterium]|nr:transcriptional regulator MntR [Bacillota bacterium]